MLKKGHLSAFVSARSLDPGREIRSYREKLMSGKTRIHGASSADINYLLWNFRFLDLNATGSFWQNRLSWTRHLTRRLAEYLDSTRPSG
jgi:hypothetical protein